MTIRNARRYRIRRRRVPLAGVHCSISESSHLAYIDETGQSSVEVTPVCAGIEVGGIAVLPDPAIWKAGWVLGEMALAP